VTKLTRKQFQVYFWDTVLSPKLTKCIILKQKKLRSQGMYNSIKMSNETGRTFSRALFMRIKQYLSGRMNKKMNLQSEVQSYFQTSIKDVMLQYMNLLDMKKLSKTSNGRKQWRRRCQ